MIERKSYEETKESLVGKLKFLSKAVRGSKAFNIIFYDALNGVSNPNFKIRKSKAVIEDMLIWLDFLEKFNGITFESVTAVNW